MATLQPFVMKCLTWQARLQLAQKDAQAEQRQLEVKAWSRCFPDLFASRFIRCFLAFVLQ